MNYFELMNLYFVCIKVDREERPDLDSIYMKAVQVTTGSGGWPLTAFLTPDGKPFYGGTYFPPEDKHGIPGFPKLLKSVADAYINSRSEIDKHSEKLTANVAKMMNITGQINPIAESTLKVAFDSFYSEFDSFPMKMLTFLVGALLVRNPPQSIFSRFFQKSTVQK